MKALHLFLCVAALSACQRLDFSDEDPEDNGGTVTVRPSAVGLGTAEAPWTVAQALGDGAPMDSAGWVIGYVVGAARQSLNNAFFSADHDVTSNLLLADQPTCRTASRCLPVELKSNTIKGHLALPYNKNRLGQCVMVHGTVGLYYKSKGLRSVDAGHWLEGFDVDVINPHPEEWGEGDTLSWR